MVSESDVTMGLIHDGDMVTGEPLLVNVNENDSFDLAMIGLTFPSQCSVNELYPLISSTVLVSDDNDTFKIGAIYPKKTHKLMKKIFQHAINLVPEMHTYCSITIAKIIICKLELFC